MKQRVKVLLMHPLISGSSVVFIGSLVANIFNYIFNYSLARWLLSPSDYGLVTSLTSIFVLFALFPGTLNSIFAKFSAKYYAKSNKEDLSNLIEHGLKLVMIIGIVVFGVLILLVPVTSSFLHIKDERLTFLIFLSVFIAILSSLPFGILQGRMRFYLISILNGIGPIIKIILGVALIFLGLSVFGAMIGIFLSILFPFLCALFFTLRHYESKKKIRRHLDQSTFLKEFKLYSLKFFLASLGIAIISNTDIILVRHFFEPLVSGHYAALSLMGKAIFYLTSPIYFVFFPLIAYKKEKEEKILATLLLAGAIVFLFSVSLSFIYFIFPHFVLNIFFPTEEYKVLALFLGPFSLYILVFSLAFLLNNFFLSIGKTDVYKIDLFLAFLFILLVYFFHQTLYQIIGILFFVSFLLLSFLVIYYRHNGRG